MATMLNRTREFYTWAMKMKDPRVDDWFLMKTPIPIASIFVLYLFVVWLGPIYMKNKPALHIKWLMVLYNLGLVALSLYMFYEFLVTSLQSNYSYRCQPVDYSNNILPLRMARVCWWFFFSKVIELLDTVFFILRKKTEQVTFLHVYHHCTMIINWWLGAGFVAGGQSWFVAMLNSFVHIFMYTYYGLSAIGPHMQKFLWWKRYLTGIQLMQFLAFVVHTGSNIVIDCDFPKGYSIAVFIYAISLIVLFGNFYYQTYSRKMNDKSLKSS